MKLPWRSGARKPQTTEQKIIRLPKKSPWQRSRRRRKKIRLPQPPVLFWVILGLAAWHYFPQEAKTYLRDVFPAPPASYTRSGPTQETKTYPRRNTSPAPSYAQTGPTIECYAPRIIDGDTLTCNKTRIRLRAIDAPEMPDHCRAGRRCTKGDPYASKRYLQALTRGHVVCYPYEIDRYGRTIADCVADGVDVSCAMVDAGHAVERYSSLSC